MNNQPIANDQQPFQLYAQYYDLLYSDKDYKKEAEYIHSLIQTYKPGAKTVLSLGCGTGKYEFELEKLGYEVIGVDLSQQMIDIAINIKCKSNCEFLQGDIRDIRLNKKFDVVISMFHVMCYQTTNEDLLRALKTASVHLNKGGLFLFDFWYGPAVLTDPPIKKTKFIENKQLSISRKTTSKIDVNKNIVEVNFDIDVFDKNKQQKYNFNELHKMRYLFLPEMKVFNEQAGFYKNKFLKWMSHSKNLSFSTWYGVSIISKINNF